LSTPHFYGVLLSYLFTIFSGTFFQRDRSLFQVAIPDVVEAAKNADILVFVVPHQFIQRICGTLQGKIKSTAVGLSLIKVRFRIYRFVSTSQSRFSKQLNAATRLSFRFLCSARPMKAE